MSTFVNLNRKLYIDGVDISDQMKAATFTRGRRAKEADTWGGTTRRFAAGNLFAMLSGSGLTAFGAGSVDATLEAMLGQQGSVMSLLAEDGSAGKAAFCQSALVTEYNPADGASSKEFFAFAFASKAADHFAGKVSMNQSVSGSTNAAALQLGALTAADNEAHYICAHLLSVTGSPTFDIQLQSASDEVFTTPNDQGAALAQMTAAGDHAFQKTVPGSDITDTWWRAEVTYGGSGSGVLAIMIGKEGPARA